MLATVVNEALQLTSSVIGCAAGTVLIKGTHRRVLALSARELDASVVVVVPFALGLNLLDLGQDVGQLGSVECAAT